jgi:predicted acetyltransferase
VTDQAIQLVQAHPADGGPAWEMWQEIGPGENGFQNGGFGVARGNVDDYVQRIITASRPGHQEPGKVPQTTYWLYVDGRIVGYSKLRHHLNETLMKEGGHIGFCIRPTERGKGYGNLLLERTLQAATLMNIERVLLTCDENNERSRKVIEHSGGEVESIEGGNCRYWIRIAKA